eukprot:m.7269 g.7269  ORF g.7269 m.7269 type:complete len:892 (+) comp5230_c0_seq2:154-2829(+)
MAAAIRTAEKHKVFEITSRLNLKAPSFKVTAIDVFNERAYVGTSVGQLVWYHFPPNDNSARMEGSKRSFIESHSSMTQLKVVPELSLIITLADSYIHVHDLAERFQITKVQKTKNTLYFSHSVGLKGIARAPTPQELATATRDQLLLRLCCVMKRKYAIFEWEGNQFQLKHEWALPDTPKSIAWCNAQILSGFKKEILMFDAYNGSCRVLSNTPSRSDPLIAPISYDMIAVGVQTDSDAPTITFKDLDGLPALKYGIPWDRRPLNVAVKEPFIFTINDRGIEVRYFNQTPSLAQVIPMDNLLFLCKDGDNLFVGTAATLQRLQFVPFPEQVDALMANEKFVEASIVAKYTNEPEDIKDRRMRSITQQHAHYEFARGHFQEALRLMKNVDSSPVVVFKLYPWLVGTKGGDASMPKLTQDQKTEAIGALIDYLVEKRPELRVANELSETDEETARRKHSLSLVDTTLLECYLLTNPGMVGPFVRTANDCDLGRTEKLLNQHNKTKELIMFYKTRKLHETALSLLEKAALQRASPSAYRELLEYLQALEASDLPVLLQHLKAVYKINKDDVMVLLTSPDYAVTRSFDRALVVDFLTHHATDLVVPYLEHVVNEWQDETPVVHDELAMAYFLSVRNDYGEYFQKLQGTQPLPLGTEPGSLGTRRSRFFAFLNTSTLYDPRPLLREMTSPKTSGLFEERAVLFGRMGHHKEALQLLVTHLRNPDMAERYCEQYYDGEICSDLYQNLIELYLVTPIHPPFQERALHLLRNHSSKLEPKATLGLLPQTTRLCDIKEFLSLVLQSTMRDTRTAEVTRAFRAAQRLQVTEQKHALENHHFEVTEDTYCAKCGTRIGTHAFAIFPCGAILNFFCYEDDPVCPVHKATGGCTLKLRSDESTA